MKQNMQLDTKFSNIERINPLFSRCDIAILATNLNRNNSFISKQTVEKAIPSLFNIPIVAENIEEKDNFGGHGGKIEIKDSDVRFIQTTSPIGLVPESANVYWNKLPDENGVEQDYLIAEGCFLWTGRYEFANRLIGKKFGQSMEISVNDSNWTTYEGKKVMDIKDFTFSALCVLGIATEDDPNGHIEPAFSSASIIAYSLDKVSFQEEFKLMMSELKFSISNYMKGGNKMEETKTEELVQEQFESTEEVTDEKEFKETEVTVEVEDEKDDESSEENETEGESEDKEEKYSLVESELSELKEKYSLLESEVIGLREFKATKLHEEKEIQINEVFSTIGSQLSEDELTPFKAKAFEMEVAELKKELFALIGEKELSKTKQETKTASFSMSILSDIPSETTISGSYDSIIKKYNK